MGLATLSLEARSRDISIRRCVGFDLGLEASFSLL